MARRKYEFKPDKEGSGILSKLYITRRQRLTLLRWALYALVILVLSLVQDVILSRIGIRGATTDLVPAGILLLTMMLGVEEGAIFAVVASTLFYFSGSAPGPYAIPFLTVLGTVVSIFRYGYLYKSFGSVLFCAAVTVMAYEMLVFVTGSFLGVVPISRFVAFCITGGLSVAALPLLYPVFFAIGKIGGETWKD